MTVVKILNLYAGIGGNRKKWDGHQVTAVESDPKIAAVYGNLFPDDELIVGDAEAVLLDRFAEFDLIWSSPPCQSLSRMVKFGRNRSPRLPDLSLYSQVVFLQNWYEGLFVVENVISYFPPLLPPKKIGRHLFWTNFEFHADEVPSPKGFINPTIGTVEALQDWLGIHYPKPWPCYDGNHCPTQPLRNCVHPDLGLQILEAAEGRVITRPEQLGFEAADSS